MINVQYIILYICGRYIKKGEKFNEQRRKMEGVLSSILIFIRFCFHQNTVDELLSNRRDHESDASYAASGRSDLYVT